MIEIEPIIENVELGDVVVIESGTPDSPGWVATAHKVSDRGGFSVITIETLTCNLNDGKRITRITRPAPPIPILPIPDEQGVRFWARWKSVGVREYIVTDGDRIVNLKDEGSWERFLFEGRHSVAPALEPETVPVPAHLIQEAKDRIDEGSVLGAGSAWVIVRDIVRAVREREAGDE